MLCIGLSFHGGDSSYNAYETAFRRHSDAMGLPVEIFWLAGRDRPFAADVLPRLDGICFTGGADVAPERYGRPDVAEICRIDTARDEVEFAEAQHVAERPIPVLAICRGSQLLNVFHGGTLIPDLGEMNAVHRGPPIRSHSVDLEPGTMLERITGVHTGISNSSHHQAVDRLANGFRAAARAVDGTIEAYEPAEPGSRPFFLALQWHPELMAAGLPLADAPFRAFLEALSA